jgi:hypothetical protein
MRGAFHGWKRKTGLVTLTLSLLLLLLLMRSRTTADLIELQSPNVCCIFVSGGDRFVFVVVDRFVQMVGTDFESRTVSIRTAPLSMLRGVRTSVRWQSFPGSHVNSSDLLRGDARDTMHSYWWVISPMTLLSACLILWKPRKRASG